MVDKRGGTGTGGRDLRPSPRGFDTHYLHLLSCTKIGEISKKAKIWTTKNTVEAGKGWGLLPPTLEAGTEL